MLSVVFHCLQRITKCPAAGGGSGALIKPTNKGGGGGNCRSDGRTIFAIMGSRLNDLNALPAVHRQGIASFTTTPRRVGRYKLDKNGRNNAVFR